MPRGPARFVWLLWDSSLSFRLVIRIECQMTVTVRCIRYKYVSDARYFHRLSLQDNTESQRCIQHIADITVRPAQLPIYYSMQCLLMRFALIKTQQN